MMGKEYHRLWHIVHKADRSARAKERYLLNSDKLKESCRKYYRKNRRKKLDKTRKQKYGITPEAYALMHQQQGGVCAICKRTCTCGRSLAVDHNHVTGAIRGLLCSRCNRGIGLFNESVDYLNSAISYINKNTTSLE